MNAKLKALIADTLGVSEQLVVPALSRESEDRWDSLSHLRLITAVEQVFAVKLTMDEIQSIVTAGDLAGLLERRGVSEILCVSRFINR